MINKIILFYQMDNYLVMEVFMDIRKLRIFREVAKQQSFTNAAKALYMTQPAISHAILELEKELNTPLFERFPKIILLTPAGEQFLIKVQQLLLLYDDIHKHKSTLDSSSTLRIGSSITIANDELCPLLKHVKDMYPDIHLQIEIASAASTMKKLEEHAIDMAFIEGSIVTDDIYSIPFSSYQIKAICSKEYAQEHSLNCLDDVLSQPLLLREKGSAIRDVLDSALVLKDRTVLPAWTSTNSSVLLKAALSGFGIAFLPDTMIHKKLQEGRLVVVELEDFNLQNINHLVYKKHKHLNAAMQSLIEYASIIHK